MNKEATERGLLSLTPEIITPKISVRNFTGKSITETSPSRSISDGKPLPHYLRASTSSCHDFCKYGRKHAFESKGKHRTFSKVSGNSTAPDEQNRGKILNLGQRRKKSVVKLKETLHPKIELFDRPIAIEEEALPPARTIKSVQDFEIIKQKSTSTVKKIGSSEEPEFIKFNTPSPFQKVESPDELEAVKLNTPSPLLEKVESPDEPETIKQNIPPVEKIDLYEDPELVTQKTPQLVEKTESSVNHETARQKGPFKKTPLSECDTIKQKTRSVRTTTASAKPKIKEKAPSPVVRSSVSVKPKVKQMASLLGKKLDASVKPSFSGKTRTLAVKLESPKNLSTGVTGRKKKESVVIKSVGQPTVGGKKDLRPPSASLSPQPHIRRVSDFKLKKYGSTKATSPLKNQNKVGKAELEIDNMKEKTLYIIEPKPEKEDTSQSLQLKASNYQSSPSHSSSSLASTLSSSLSVSNHEAEEEEEEEEEAEVGDSESTLSEASESVYEHGEREINQVEYSIGEDGKILRRAATVHPEDKDLTPHKLKFRRGKVVNPQSENNGPRRLRFRQGRRMGENQNGKGELGRRSFRRQRESVGGDSNHLDPEAQTVVLRHQDVHDKKDTQALFNHVIEETASKLVETRKSKVKALVGAFETVISLQESKPAASV